MEENYVTKEELTQALQALTNNVQSMLSAYYTKAEMEQKLTTYAKQSDLEGLMDDYYNKATTDNKLEDYVRYDAIHAWSKETVENGAVYVDTDSVSE